MRRSSPVARALAAALLLGAAVVGAQTPVPDSTAAPGAAPRMAPGAARIGAIVQRRLELTDDQAARLRDVAQRYAARRRALLAEERAARRAVREEVARGPQADQPRVEGALDRLYGLEQRRAELAGAEQRELGAFLTPTQRARYAGLQERAFRAAQDIRRRREAGLAGPPPALPGPPAVTREERQRRRAERRAERRATLGAPGARPPTR